MNTHLEDGHTAAHNAEVRLGYALARVRQHDRANATAEIQAARDYIAQAKRDLDLALIQMDAMRNSWRALNEGLKS